MIKRLYILFIFLAGCVAYSVADDNISVVACQYWVDDDFDNRVTIDTTATNITIDNVHLAPLNLSNGLHTLYFRAKNSEGVWGSISYVRFCLYDAAVKDAGVSDAPLDRFRYMVGNGGTAKTVELEPSTRVENEYVLPLPSVNTMPVKADEIRIDSILVDQPKAIYYRDVTFYVASQYRNTSGEWSNPATISGSFSKRFEQDYAEIPINGSLNFTKPSMEDLKVLRFDISAQEEYSIQADAPCQMIIYMAYPTEELDYYPLSKIYTVDSEQALDSYRMTLYEGMYFCALFDAQKNLANPSSDITLTLKTICRRPEFNRVGNEMTITTATEDAQIYYTVDGSTPTEKSTLYQGKFQLPHNGWLKAVVAKAGFGKSYIDSTYIYGIKAAEATASFSDGVLTLTSDIPDASIYYHIGDDLLAQGLEPDILYTEPIELKDNTIVYYMVKSPLFDNSDLSSYTPQYFKCKDVTFEYDGRSISMLTDDGTDVYFTIDGSDPLTSETVQSVLANSPVLLTDTCVVKAYARGGANNLAPSVNVTTYKVPVHYNGAYVHISVPGHLGEAFKWCEEEGEKVTLLHVCGTINEADIAYIKTMKDLDGLELNEAEIEGKTLPDEAFAGVNPLYFISPFDLTAVGKNILKDCPRLGGLQWNASIALPDDVCGDTEYANLIVFVEKEDLINASRFKNVVVNGVALNEIELVDDAPNASFFATRQFRVSKISYTRNFTMETLLTGECQGWEAICLPFNPVKIVHEKNGELVPFWNYNGTSDVRKPFWLCYFTSTGFSDAWSMGNQPQIICMPNNPAYADEYILSGNVTFYSENVYVPSTSIGKARKNNYQFVNNWENKPKSEYISVLNTNQEYNGYRPGSVFVPGLRDAKVFEPYLEYVPQNKAQMRAPLVPIDTNTTGIETLPERLTERDVYSEDGILYINSGTDGKYSLYDISGKLIKVLDVHTGVNEFRGIAKGVYMVKKIKVVIR